MEGWLVENETDACSSGNLFRKKKQQVQNIFFRFFYFFHFRKHRINKMMKEFPFLGYGYERVCTYLYSLAIALIEYSGDWDTIFNASLTLFEFAGGSGLRLWWVLLSFLRKISKSSYNNKNPASIMDILWSARLQILTATLSLYGFYKLL